MDKKIIDQISQLSMDLKLPTFRKDIETVLAQAAKQSSSYAQVILSLLSREAQRRDGNRGSVCSNSSITCS